jgi:hypothetical protein
MFKNHDLVVNGYGDNGAKSIVTAIFPWNVMIRPQHFRPKLHSLAAEFHAFFQMYLSSCLTLSEMIGPVSGLLREIIR